MQLAIPNSEQNADANRDRFVGCLLGLAVGDALGAPVESLPRGSFPPVRQMIGSIRRGLAPGWWTDDTALALALAHSLVECQGFDARHQMEQYCDWLSRGHLYGLDSRLFIGPTTNQALLRYRQTSDPCARIDQDARPTNGCIMRLAPVAMLYYRDSALAEFFAEQSACTTHGAAECRDAARLLARILVRALSGLEKREILFADAERFDGHKAICRLASGAYLEKNMDQIRGTSHVVDSLEAALWCFATTNSFADAVLCAVNLGDDADTTAAVCGQIAGAHYGCKGIPAEWLSVLACQSEIRRVAEQLFELALQR